jgi:hypothetical protein
LTSSIDRAKDFVSMIREDCMLQAWADHVEGYIGAIEALCCVMQYECGGCYSEFHVSGDPSPADHPSCLDIYAKDRRRTDWCDGCNARNEFDKLFPEEVD